LSKCPVCELNLVQKFTHVCDSCAGRKCDSCGKVDGELYPVRHGRTNTKELLCLDCLDNTYSKKSQEDVMLGFGYGNTTTKICYGCGDSIHSDSIFCNICEAAISNGQCTECGEYVTHIDETGRCANCSITHDAKYLVSPQTSNREQEKESVFKCACNLNIAKYEGAVCKECVDMYWGDEDGPPTKAVYLTKRCTRCGTTYIKEEDDFCYLCKNKS
jgi:hypothetical protein